MQVNSIDFLAFFKDVQDHIEEIAAYFLGVAEDNFNESRTGHGAYFDVTLLGEDIITVIMKKKGVTVYTANKGTFKWLNDKGVNVLNQEKIAFEDNFIKVLQYIDQQLATSEPKSLAEVPVPTTCMSSFCVKPEDPFMADKWWVSLIETTEDELPKTSLQTIMYGAVRTFTRASLVIHLLRTYSIDIDELYYHLTFDSQAQSPLYS